MPTPGASALASSAFDSSICIAGRLIGDPRFLDQWNGLRHFIRARSIAAFSAFGLITGQTQGKPLIRTVKCILPHRSLSSIERNIFAFPIVERNSKLTRAIWLDRIGSA
jgi:hypothetical protein